MGFDRTSLCKDEDLLADDLFQQLADSFATLNAEDARRGEDWEPTLFGKTKHRSYCAAFKPLVILRALETMQLGDY
eukprot:2788354-Prymnesium_polylepis.1